jgi:drug/metabolite transporter (DMT)-like permease
MQVRPRKASFLTAGSLLLAALCWGLAPVATRYLLDYFSPLQLVLLRFLISAIFFLPLLWPLRAHHWTLKELALAVFCGLVGVIGYNLIVTYGLSRIPAGMAGLLIATEPIWILLIAALVLHEKIAWSVLAGLLLSLGGIVLLLSRSIAGATWNTGVLGGSLLVLLAALMWSIYTVAVRTLSKKIGARVSTALTLVIGTLPLLAFWDPTSLALLPHLNLAAWGALLLLTLGSTVVATILWNYGVARTASSQAGLFLYLVPLISVAGGALFLHEQISFVTLASGLLIVSGVALAQIRQFIPAQKAPEQGAFAQEQ